ncbi:hypothetical protein [Chitinophaga filiformis]|uniref:Uncharacterized protein n=1 Tax=Chitinophaga filiformis TaxID=104663 RepID=A0ABY4HY32_CHIFI|nr:hypothetical protein [Chitinophaga filiformis]UPK68049.1 hypothetical protein MYF79_24155 [Chitinophaga filiformis]
MKKLQLGIMAIASLTGVGIASSGFTAKHKFATITVYAYKNGSTFSYYTQTASLPLGAVCGGTTDPTCVNLQRAPSFYYRHFTSNIS